MIRQPHDRTDGKSDVSVMQSRQQFVSDVFHAISQPLTALRCSLELALLQGGDATIYRSALEDALNHAERVSSCAAFLRRMAEAEDPGTPRETDLSACFAAAAEEFGPIFASFGGSLTATCDVVKVFADPANLERAFFLALDYGAAERRDVEVHILEPASVEIRFAAPREGNNPGRREHAQQSFELAQRMFSAMGAAVSTSRQRDEYWLTVRC